jgi:glycosyltransferase involved in cell wall biosynthesis
MLALLFFLIPIFAYTQENNFVIVIPSYNNAPFCEANLVSVFNQTYPNYRVIYIDDASSDETYIKAEALTQAYGQQDRVTLIKNDERRLAMENIYRAVQMCDDHEIVVLLDGDDWFYDPHVLKALNAYYSNPAVWMTYGSYIVHPGGKKGECASPIPYHVITSNSVRKNSEKKWVLGHLRSFYTGLFKKIKVEDLYYKGKFLEATYDFAIMIPMLEMAASHARFIPKILYVYNRLTPINDDKIRAGIQRECKDYILSLSPYEPLSELFTSAR